MLETFRANPARNNLGLSVRRLQNARMDELRDEVRRTFFQGLKKCRLGAASARAVVFCLRISDVECLSAKIKQTMGMLSDVSILEHHSKMSEDARSEKLRR